MLDSTMSPPAMLLEACRADSFRTTSAQAYTVLDRVIDDIVFESVA